jgi:dihydrofolate reductase
MRKVIAEIAVSLDGFIEGPNGELDWLIFEDEVAYANNFLSRFDTIFYGRVAYEKFGVPRPIDPAQSEMEREFHNTVNNMRKFVFSRTVKHVAGNGMVVNHSVEAEIKRIRGEEGKGIWLCGGAEIIDTFADLNLIDEYILSVQPVILGAGKPLFKSRARPLPLKLLHIENLKSGVVIMRYAPERKGTQNS